MSMDPGACPPLHLGSWMPLSGPLGLWMLKRKPKNLVLQEPSFPPLDPWCHHSVSGTCPRAGFWGWQGLKYKLVSVITCTHVLLKCEPCQESLSEFVGAFQALEPK